MSFSAQLKVNGKVVGYLSGHQCSRGADDRRHYGWSYSGLTESRESLECTGVAWHHREDGLPALIGKILGSVANHEPVLKQDGVCSARKGHGCSQ